MTLQSNSTIRSLYSVMQPPIPSLSSVARLRFSPKSLMSTRARGPGAAARADGQTDYHSTVRGLLSCQFGADHFVSWSHRPYRGRYCRSYLAMLSFRLLLNAKLQDRGPGTGCFARSWMPAEGARTANSSNYSLPNRFKLFVRWPKSLSLMLTYVMLLNPQARDIS